MTPENVNEANGAGEELRSSSEQRMVGLPASHRDINGRLHFDCAICERACIVPVAYKQNRGRKLVCLGCYHSLDPFAAECAALIVTGQRR